MTNRKTYTAEFKRQTIELAAREVVGPIRAACDLGISPLVLYRLSLPLIGRTLLDPSLSRWEGFFVPIT